MTDHNIKSIKISIDTENSAFEGADLVTELECILQGLIHRLKTDGVDDYAIRDSNGNSVGYLDVLK